MIPKQPLHVGERILQKRLYGSCANGLLSLRLGETSERTVTRFGTNFDRTRTSSAVDSFMLW